MAVAGWMGAFLHRKLDIDSEAEGFAVEHFHLFVCFSRPSRKLASCVGTSVGLILRVDSIFFFLSDRTFFVSFRFAGEVKRSGRDAKWRWGFLGHLS